MASSNSNSILSSFWIRPSDTHGLFMALFVQKIFFYFPTNPWVMVPLYLAAHKVEPVAWPLYYSQSRKRVVSFCIFSVTNLDF